MGRIRKILTPSVAVVEGGVSIKAIGTALNVDAVLTVAADDASNYVHLPFFTEHDGRCLSSRARRLDVHFGVDCRMSAFGENLIQAACPVSGASRAGRYVRKWLGSCRQASPLHCVLSTCWD